LKKLVILVLKISISVGIIAYLAWDAVRTPEGKQAFHDMLTQPKHWDLLAGAFLLSATGVTLTLIRWCYLVRALGIRFPMRNALRIGYLGYLFNLAPMGIVGGDLLKAVMLGREYPGYQAKAVASVVVDRVVGLYILFVVAATAILLTRSWALPDRTVQITCWTVLAITAVGTLGAAVVLMPGFTNGRWSHAISRIPRLGPHLASMFDAVQMYRRNYRVLLLSSLITVGVHVTFTLSIYLVSRALPGDFLALATQFVVYPISGVASTIPLPAGPFEGTFKFLYAHLHQGNVLAAESQALVIALVFRLMSILLAAVGFCYYLGSRREVAELMHEAETERPAPGAVHAVLPAGAGSEGWGRTWAN
jgi:uncharacterized protein (TIRG00374 family)